MSVIVLIFQWQLLETFDRLLLIITCVMSDGHERKEKDLERLFPFH